MELEFTGERFVPGCGEEIAYEHFSRYFFAAPFISGKRVLDLPSGEGYGSFFLSTLAESVVGGDISELAVNSSKNKYKNSNLTFQTLDMTDLKFPENKFDVITCFEGIEHIEKEQQDMSLEGFAKILGPGGVLIISTPNRKVYDDVGHRNEFHKREYYFEEFKNHLKSYFKNVDFFGQTTADGVIFRSYETNSSPHVANIQRIKIEGLAIEESIEEHTYFIAICSQAQSKLPSNTFFYNFEKKLIQEKINIENRVARTYFEAKIDSVVLSYEQRLEVKLGRIIRRIFKKIGF